MGQLQASIFLGFPASSEERKIRDFSENESKFDL